MTTKQLDKILTFAPQYKSVIWGGNRISELKGDSRDTVSIGESWEISALEGHESVLDDGPLKGTKISELAETFGAKLLGQTVVERYGNKFPLLIKLIDARDILSLQVHPNDTIAQKKHNARGKSEMWYIIDARQDSRIFCGLAAPLSPESLDSHIDNKSIMDVVATYRSRAGQFYFIPAGTIHSIGAGNLIAEVQDSSDITYRVYDHDRTDADGRPRQLHIDQAREAIDFTFPRDLEPTASVFESSTLRAVKSEHFEVDYFKVDGTSARLNTDHKSFTVIIVTNGSITIKADDARKTLTAGHTALIPACVEHLTIEGCGIALASHI